MKSAFLMILGVLLFVSCENSDEPFCENDPVNYFPLSTGSYWVYDTYLIDSTGMETIKSSKDTIIVIGDTIIDSRQYKVVLGKEVPHSSSSDTERYYRDSAGYILDIEQNIVFPDIAIRDSFGLQETPASWGDEHYYQWFYTLESYSESVSISSGTFDSLFNRKLTVVRCDSINEILCTLNHLYAPDIGRIIFQYTYVQAFEQNGSYFEGRLVDYFIPPQE